MDDIFFKELSIPQPKYNLWIHGWSHGKMTGEMIIELEKIFLDEKPEVVYVQGDTNTVLAWAIATSKLWIKLAHIESWLRSYDKTMPEEINRVLVDHCSDYLFSPTKKQENILLNEWIEESKIITVWNTIADAILLVENMNYWQLQYSANDYIFFTIHRPVNVDSKENLKSILNAIIEIKKISWKKIVFSVHPRTYHNIQSFGLENLLEAFIILEPIGFIKNIQIQKSAYMIITDSWWIQEEACILQKKTIVLRENTERPETLEVWWSMLVWNNHQKILKWFIKLEQEKVDWYNPFWNGKACEKIFQITQ